jgi:hypothetical protein
MWTGAPEAPAQFVRAAPFLRGVSVACMIWPLVVAARSDETAAASAQVTS